MSATLINNVEAVLGGIARGFASAPVQIGTVTLEGVEVPSEFVVGTQQALVVHKLPGGDRVINSIGPDPERLSRAGLFTGPNTAARYQTLDAMRIAGAPVTLSVSGLSYQVMLARFEYRITQRGAVVPYVIEVEIIPQLGVVQSTAGTSLLSTLLGPDAASALASVASVGLTGLTTAQGFLTTASSLSAGGVALASAPATLVAYTTALQGAGGSLAGVAASASAALDGTAGSAQNGIGGSAAEIVAMAQQAQLLASAVQAGGFVNRALAGAAQASGQPRPVPSVVS